MMERNNANHSLMPKCIARQELFQEAKYARYHSYKSEKYV